MGYRLKNKCPHGNIIYSIEKSPKGTSMHGGIPKCCLREGSRPAEGETFIIPGYLINIRGQLIKDD